MRALVLLCLLGAATVCLLLWLVQRLGAVAAGAVQWPAVLVAVGESAMLLRQRPGGTIAAGAAGVVLALVLLLRTEPERALTLRVTEGISEG